MPFTGPRKNRSGKQSREDLGVVDVREPLVAAVVGEGEAVEVEAEQVEDRGVEVGDVAAVGDGVVAEVVGRAVGLAALDSAAGEPDGEAVGVVVAAVLALGAGGPAELAAPDDQRLVEQAALLQVGQQTGDRAGRSARSKSGCRRRCWCACPTAGRP